jgi:predicted nuclease of restriction endonuclease-like (RecB) superfamily
MTKSLQAPPEGYVEWLAEVKQRVHAAQQRAVLAVNRELLRLYWQLGKDLLERQTSGSWGTGVIDQVSRDLRTAFPEMKGFSPSNLKYMRAFAEAWPDFPIRQQAVGELPWGHNVVLC